MKPTNLITHRAQISSYATATPKAAILADPSASYWLQNALRALGERDILDAVSDAVTLAETMKDEYRRATGRAFL